MKPIISYQERLASLSAKYTQILIALGASDLDDALRKIERLKDGNTKPYKAIKLSVPYVSQMTNNIRNDC